MSDRAGQRIPTWEETSRQQGESLEVLSFSEESDPDQSERVCDRSPRSASLVSL